MNNVGTPDDGTFQFVVLPTNHGWAIAALKDGRLHEQLVGVYTSLEAARADRGRMIEAWLRQQPMSQPSIANRTVAYLRQGDRAR